MMAGSETSPTQHHAAPSCKFAATVGRAGKVATQLRCLGVQGSSDHPVRSDVDEPVTSLGRPDDVTAQS